MLLRHISRRTVPCQRPSFLRSVLRPPPPIRREEADTSIILRTWLRAEVRGPRAVLHINSSETPENVGKEDPLSKIWHSDLQWRLQMTRGFYESLSFTAAINCFTDRDKGELSAWQTFSLP